MQQQATIFEKSLNNVFFQSFQNINCKKRKVENPEIDGLIQKRKKLKEEVKNPLNRRAQADLEIVEKTIANLVSDKNRDKVEKIFRNVSNSDNSCNTIGLWEEVKKLFPKILKDHKGRSVTKVTAFKLIIMRKYIQRLRKRPANPEIKLLMELKEENARKIIKIARDIKTPPWTQDKLTKVLRTLKNNKC